MNFTARLDKIKKELALPPLTIFFYDEKYEYKGRTITKIEAEALVTMADTAELLVFDSERGKVHLPGARHIHFDSQDYNL